MGASVIVQGTTVGVSTDAQGRFELVVPAPVASRVLEISYLGYETAHVAVGSRTRFDVTLREAASEIEQVVVTALGIKRQEKALSYNVQQVAPSDITMVKDANFMNFARRAGGRCDDQHLLVGCRRCLEGGHARYEIDSSVVECPVCD